MNIHTTIETIIVNRLDYLDKASNFFPWLRPFLIFTGSHGNKTTAQSDNSIYTWHSSEHPITTTTTSGKYVFRSPIKLKPEPTCKLSPFIKVEYKDITVKKPYVLSYLSTSGDWLFEMFFVNEIETHVYYTYYYAMLSPTVNASPTIRRSLVNFKPKEPNFKNKRK
jgi:hypothetical protein